MFNVKKRGYKGIRKHEQNFREIEDTVNEPICT